MWTPLPVSALRYARERGDERFSFARLHLGDFPVVQDDAADELHVEVPHIEVAAARFANQGEGRHQRGIDRLAKLPLVIRVIAFESLEAALHFGLEGQGSLAELRIGELLHLRLEGVDLRHNRLNAPRSRSVLVRKARYNVIYDPFDIHFVWFRGPQNLSDIRDVLRCEDYSCALATGTSHIVSACRLRRKAPDLWVAIQSDDCIYETD